MPLFYFHFVTEGGSYCPDEDGSAFDSLDDAYLDALRAALDISFEMLRARQDPNRCRFEIADASGKVLLDVPFGEVLRPSPTKRGMPLAKDFLEEMSARLQRHSDLKADLALQLRRVHRTVEETRRLLSRSRALAL